MNQVYMKSSDPSGDQEVVTNPGYMESRMFKINMIWIDIKD